MRKITGGILTLSLIALLGACGQDAALRVKGCLGGSSTTDNEQ